MRVPVVATRVGGPAEVITEACGALVDPLDVESIAGGMLLALELPGAVPGGGRGGGRTTTGDGRPSGSRPC